MKDHIPSGPTRSKMPQWMRWTKSDVYNPTKTTPDLIEMLNFENYVEFMRLDKNQKKVMIIIITASTQIGRPPSRALKGMKHCRLVFLL